MGGVRGWTGRLLACERRQGRAARHTEGGSGVQLVRSVLERCERSVEVGASDQRDQWQRPLLEEVV